MNLSESAQKILDVLYHIEDGLRELEALDLVEFTRDPLSRKILRLTITGRSLVSS